MSLHTTNNKQQDKPILYIYLAKHDTHIYRYFDNRFYTNLLIFWHWWTALFYENIWKHKVIHYRLTWKGKVCRITNRTKNKNSMIKGRLFKNQQNDL